MRAILAVLLLLSLGLTACIVEPGGGPHEHGWNGGDHANFHGDQGGQENPGR